MRYLDNDTRGLKIDARISLGSIIQIITLIVLGIVGYVTLQNNVSAMVKDHMEMRATLKEVMNRENTQSEFAARETAVIDEIEKRMTRIENLSDWKR